MKLVSLNDLADRRSVETHDQPSTTIGTWEPLEEDERTVVTERVRFFSRRYVVKPCTPILFEDLGHSRLSEILLSHSGLCI